MRLGFLTVTFPCSCVCVLSAPPRQLGTKSGEKSLLPWYRGWRDLASASGAGRFCVCDAATNDPAAHTATASVNSRVVVKVVTGTYDTSLAARAALRPGIQMRCDIARQARRCS